MFYSTAWRRCSLGLCWKKTVYHTIRIGGQSVNQVKHFHVPTNLSACSRNCAVLFFLPTSTCHPRGVKLSTDEIPLLLNIMLHPHWVGCARRWKVRFQSCCSTCQLWVWQKTWYWNIGNECKPFFEEAVFFLVVCFRKLVFHLILVAELLSMKDSKPASPGMACLFPMRALSSSVHTAPKKFETQLYFYG